MINQQHLIIPPQELVQQWVDEIYGQTECDDARDEHIAIQAARWGYRQALSIAAQAVHPAPVPVSERLPDLSPSAGDFSASGLLWWFMPRLGWRIGSRDSIDCIPFPTHWLPFNALPMYEQAAGR